MPSGSYLAISHGASDLLGQAMAKGIGDSWKGKIQQDFTWRSHDEVERFFAGTDLVEPGVVPVEAWRPDPGAPDVGKSSVWGAIGRKR